MAYYVPFPRSQFDPVHELHSSHKFNNCTMAVGATAADYHSGGRVKVRAGDMRHHQDDQVLGTDLRDLAKAWDFYGLDLVAMQNGWDGVIENLKEGRMILLPGKSGLLRGACSQSQRTEHMIGLHPRGKRELVGDKIYAYDPYCKPAKWVYMDRPMVRAFYESLGWPYGITRRREP
jgi:hypothetical protein